MIGEHTRGSDFDGLLDYLTHKRDHTVIELFGVSSVENAGAEMQATSCMAPRISQSVLQISLSAATEDGDKMGRARWIELFGLIKAELLMTTHQAALVEHHDRPYQHVHGALCVIDPDTGRTPSDRYTLKPGVSNKSLPRSGPLTPAVKAQLNPADYTTRRWDSFIGKRIIRVCRAFEKLHGLRQLRTPEQSQEARLLGESRPINPKKAKYIERTGARSLLDDAGAIRDALSEPTWQARQAALARVGVRLEPFYRAKKDPNVDPPSGLRLVDMHDPKNSVAASALDVGGVGYGLKALQNRTISGTLSLRECLDIPMPTTSTERQNGSLKLPSAEDELRRAYVAARSAQREQRARNRVARRRLTAKHRAEAKQLSASIKLERRAFLLNQRPSDRMAARVVFAGTVALSHRTELKDRQRSERRALTTPALGTWTEWRAHHATHLPPAIKAQIEVAATTTGRAPATSTSLSSRLPAAQVATASLHSAALQTPTDGNLSPVARDDTDLLLAQALAKRNRDKGR